MLIGETEELNPLAFDLLVSRAMLAAAKAESGHPLTERDQETLRLLLADVEQRKGSGRQQSFAFPDVLKTDPDLEASPAIFTPGTMPDDVTIPAPGELVARINDILTAKGADEAKPHGEVLLDLLQEVHGMARLHSSGETSWPDV